MIPVTFPDGASRPFEPGVSGLDIAKSISPSLAKRTRRHDARRRAGRSRRADRPRRQDRVRRPRRSARAGADPPRRRPCAGRSGAGALSRHAGHHRPGDRERLLLRFLSRRAVHARRLRRPSKRRCARSSPRDRPIVPRNLDARPGQGLVRDAGRGVQGRTDRRDSGRREPERSTSRATGSISAAARICPRPARSARPSS